MRSVLLLSAVTIAEGISGTLITGDKATILAIATVIFFLMDMVDFFKKFFK